MAREQDTINDVLESSIEDLVKPYMDYIFKVNTNIPPEKIKEARRDGENRIRNHHQ